MFELRAQIPVEEFDYQMLMDALAGYAKPRNRVTELLRKGDIIRVKKGIYVFGPKYRRSPICLEALANLIYGPSYVSMEYALSYYRMIPERVEEVTSMTTGKSKAFDTPLGRFAYQHLHPSKYATGMDYFAIDSRHRVFFATREKALADLLAHQARLADTGELEGHLLDNLRVDPEELAKLDRRRLQEIAAVYHHPNVSLLAQLKVETWT